MLGSCSNSAVDGRGKGAPQGWYGDAIVKIAEQVCEIGRAERREYDTEGGWSRASVLATVF